MQNYVSKLMMNFNFHKIIYLLDSKYSQQYLNKSN